MQLKNFLTRLGIESESTLSAIEGLKVLRQDPDKFGLVLSDFNMPGMSGGEMCLEIRKDPRLRHIPFICTSGSLIPNAVTEKYQMTETLMKPFTVDKVKETIEPFLILQRSSREHEKKEIAE